MPLPAPMSATSGTENVSVAPSVDPKGEANDINSILQRIKSLEEEKKLMAEKLASNDAKYAKLQEAKRAEMQNMMDNTIRCPHCSFCFPG